MTDHLLQKQPAIHMAEITSTMVLLRAVVCMAKVY